MVAITFLGNPGKKYNRNRHNIGFIIGQFIAEKNGINLNKKNFSSILGSGSLQGHESILIFPQTYMNNSGQSVKKAIDYYKISPADLVVVHDEIELPFGQYRQKFGGGHKGHNGLRSIVQELGTADFFRFRFGVGRPDNPHLTVADYVLSNFSKEEIDKIQEILPEISDHILDIIDDN